MKKNYRLFLKDIIQPVEAIEKFFEGLKLKKPAEDYKTSSAAIRNFEILGESARNISVLLRPLSSFSLI